MALLQAAREHYYVNVSSLSGRRDNDSLKYQSPYESSHEGFDWNSVTIYSQNDAKQSSTMKL